MLRTQEAAENVFGDEAIGQLCEAICLDAIEVAAATRASIWFFDSKGNMVCHRLVDGRDGRIRQGDVIPHAACESYFKAALEGLASITTEDVDDEATAEGEGEAGRGENRTRLDLLLVDGRKHPAAVFRAERVGGDSEWSERDLKILRELATALAWAIRRQVEPRRAQSQGKSARQSSSEPRLPGSTPQDLSWLGTDPQQEIRLPMPWHTGGPTDAQRLEALLADDDFDNE